MMSMTWVVILAIGGLFFLLLTVIVGGVAIVVIAKKSNRGLGSKSAHPEVVPCAKCGFVVPRGKDQCPSCGFKMGDLVGG